MTAAAPPSDDIARERIATDLDATLFVEAGAGTGKTHALIERIVTLVTSGRTELRHVAAITFTEAAAADLRDRVRIRLEEAARDGSLSDDGRERCRVAASEVDAAAIETLHGFAQRILSAHPLEAGLPPVVEVQDEIRASIGFEERWAAYVDDLLDDGSMEEVLLRAFTLGLDLNDLRAVANELHEHWDRVEELELAAPPLAPVDVSQLAARLEALCALRSECITAEDKMSIHLEQLERYARRLGEATGELDQLRVLAEKVPIKFSLGQKGNWRHTPVDDVRESSKAASQLRDELERQARVGVLLPLLVSLRDFILTYADERRVRGQLEFHDLLIRARGLLRDDANVRRAVRDECSHLLIDEFQDTDPLQIEIAMLIAGRETDGPPPRWENAEVDEGRLFFVGDPKQSIYRFRRADIELYQRAQERFANGTVRLTQNFRSLAPVIAWTNHTFALLMGEGGAGQAAHVPLESWRGASKEAGLSVRMVGGPFDDNIDAVRRREGREIARVIQTIKAGGWPVEGKDGSQPAKYADIAILMPQRTTLPHIEEALEEAAIPYRVESRSLVYDTQEVRDVLSILRAIDDATDQVALIAALRSPAFACGDDDLLRYYEARGRWDYRRAPPDALPGDDPVVTAMAALHDFHRRRWWEPIGGVVEAVIRERRLFELAFAHRRPRERWQRLRFLLDQARAFAEAGGRTLRQFVEWAERQAEEGTQVVETVVPEPDDDAVRIMTIHAAKGLEFPIVVMAGLNVQASRSSRERVLWQQDGTLEVRVGSREGGSIFETDGFDALVVREKELDRQEKVRLLYVAATRARDHLVVSVHHQESEEQSKEDRKSHARKLYERSLDARDLWRDVVQLSLGLGAESNGTSVAPFDDNAERREAWAKARRERIERLGRLPAIAATEVAHGARDDDPNLRKDAPAEELPPWRRGRAGTGLGRAVHAVLQSIDLASGAGVEEAARAQAAAEGIPGRVDEVIRVARNALDAPTVREAVGSRYWRELYAGAPIEGGTLEGFIDLLYETPDGLVVVDYKTDAVPSAEQLDAAVARYRLQGAAYALALEEALGRKVARCVFVFAQGARAHEREIENLPAAMDQVRDELRRRWPGA